MKRGRLFSGTVLCALMLYTFGLSVGFGTPGNRLDDECLKIARDIGPEDMMKLAFEDYLRNVNYRDRKRVSAVQKHLVNLYPDRPDLYKEAACALGECLRESGKYTQGEIKRVVGYITGLTEKYYGKQ